MNKFILLPLFILFVFHNLSLQAQNKYEIKCEMTVEEILLAQPFDIDHPTSEFARNISISLITELNVIYDELGNDSDNELDKHIQVVNNLIESAKEIEMNYSMFDDDLEFISTLD